MRDLCLRIQPGECFGFLGVNGAGKSTTFSMLTGATPPTSGDASLRGLSILSQQRALRRLVGFCPQHDALEALLTCREHLRLYAHIKGVPRRHVDDEVESLLVDLDLAMFANKRAGTLSGGNKRKLCVAIALIGAPQLVLLDEPSSGMDAASKRFLWAVIRRRTAQCCTILTTHSMEECEALCSRIGVMVDGALRCLGPIQRLKATYGQGYHVALRLAPGASPDAVLGYMQRAFEGTTLDSLEPPQMVLRLPKRAALSQLFGQLEASRAQLQFSECSVTQTTLEQVFLGMARSHAAAESMAARGGAPGASAAADPAAGPAPPANVRVAVEEAGGTRHVRVEKAAEQRLGLDLMPASAGRGVVGRVWPGYACAAGGHVREGEALVAVGGVSTSGMQVQQVYELMRRQMEATSGTTITMQFAARV